nr:hypothetical protein [Tanacetum cinerariifolium]
AIGNGPINVSLASDAKQIGEVVVTGALGIQRQEREVGYATATLDTKEVTQARVNNVTNGLAGKVSGLQIQTVSSGINPNVRVTLRGSRSLTGNNEALIVVDGVISTNDVLVSLNPDDIASISSNPYADPNGYYNAFYQNPYFVIDNNRANDRRNTLLGNIDLSYRVKDWLRVQYRLGVDASLVFSNAIPALKDLSFLDYGKIRGGITKVSQVNLPNSPFPTGLPANVDNRLVQSGLLPEETRSIEAESGLTITIGGNFNYNNNEVVSLPNGNLPLTTGGNAQLYAIAGLPYPTLQGSHYDRTADGLVKMTAIQDPF